MKEKSHDKYHDKVTFYVIRHGETEPNTRSACLGRSDVPLDSVGESQACALAAKLGEVYPDAVYSSPLSRAKDTIAKLVEGRPGTDITEDERLIERDFGEWEDMSMPQIEAEDRERFGQWMKDFVGYAVPGGESSAEVQKRVNSLIDELAPKHAGETVFLVTHLGTARHIISRCLGLTIEESWRFTMDNGSFAEIEYDVKTGCGVLKRLGV